MFTVDIDLKPILQAYKDLPQALRKEMLDDAVKAGAKVVQKIAKPQVPVSKRGKGGGGNLRKSLKVRNLRSKEPMLAAYAVVFSQRGNDKGHHASLIELGHRIFKRKKRGRGSVAATGKKYEMEPTGRSTRGRNILKRTLFSSQNLIIRAIQKEMSMDKMERKILKKLRTRARVVAKRK